MNSGFKWLLIMIACYILGLIIGHYLGLIYLNSNEYIEYKNRYYENNKNEIEYRNILKEINK